jgi:hypothetical protein
LEARRRVTGQCPVIGGVGRASEDRRGDVSGCQRGRVTEGVQVAGPVERRGLDRLIRVRPRVVRAPMEQMELRPARAEKARQQDELVPPRSGRHLCRF